MTHNDLLNIKKVHCWSSGSAIFHSGAFIHWNLLHLCYFSLSRLTRCWWDSDSFKGQILNFTQSVFGSSRVCFQAENRLHGEMRPHLLLLSTFSAQKDILGSRNDPCMMSQIDDMTYRLGRRWEMTSRAKCWSNPLNLLGSFACYVS